MDIHFIHDNDSFLNLGLAWNQLLSQSTVNVPFLRHEYQYTWWQYLGGGEWSQGDLWIAVGKSEKGELLGLAPCFRINYEPDNPKIMFIGGKEIADYLDLIVSPNHHMAFVNAFIENLRDLPESVWKQIDLYNIPEWSPTIDAMVKGAGDQGWKVETGKLQPCPSVSLEVDWETYLSKLQKKQRHELRRKIRRAESFEHEVRFHILTDPEEIHEGIAVFLDLMAFDQQKTRFLTKEMRSTLSEIMVGAFRNGWLMLAFLEAGGEPIAGYLNFDYDNQIWIYNSGINPDYMHISPGWVLMSCIIQWAIEHGRQVVDFLRGDERYKYQLGGQDRFIYRLTLSR
jgi:CelD/BcsL family acetyltransferase involved in cellulose biosynthesis